MCADSSGRLLLRRTIPLSAGQSLATSGGMPQDVSVTGLPEAGNVVVEGPNWVVNVNADRDNGVVETDDGQVLVRLDQSFVGTTSGSGFMAGTLASVWLFSEPTLMATVTVDDNGEFSSEFLVDARLIAPGEPTLQVQGVGQDGLVKAANLGVVVEQPVALTSEGASSWLLWVVGLLLLALLITLFFFLARRRNRERAQAPLMVSALIAATPEIHADGLPGSTASRINFLNRRVPGAAPLL